MLTQRKALFLGSIALGAIAATSCLLTTSLDGVSGGVKAGTDTGAADADPDSPAQPPTRPAGATTPSGKGKTLWFGVKHFHFAHSNDALKKPGAWQDWGFDIDHLCTGAVEADQSGSCLRASGADPSVIADGKRCRDNNFGSQIVSQLNVYNDRFESDTNSGLTSEGSDTIAFRLDDVDGDPDDAYAPGKLYLLAAMKGGRPAWDGTDSRQISASSVTGDDLDKPITAFPNGYIKGDVWVSGEPASFEMSMPIGLKGEPLPMKVVNGLIGFQLTRDHGSVMDGTGQFAGAIAASNVEAWLKPFVLTQTGFCPAMPQYATFMNRVQTFVDVVVGAPSLQDPKAKCDGISFGFGMNMAPIARPSEVVPAPPPSTGSCGGDAGADAAVDGG